MSEPKILMTVLPDEYLIHRFLPNYIIPQDFLREEDFFHISKTSEELSIVCRAQLSLPSEKNSAIYKCLKVIGPLDFSLVGIISKIAEVLRKRDIPIFVISTFDTDYILINKEDVKNSIEALDKDEYISLTNVIT